ncbi:hypothetical protein EXN66_Car015019 [Channa argus]|uniref:Uncharacterized protein n=1 Tax=Channa argus TaxID=215402 RepID=A0A6G1Q9X1_CHAAH|nr:hypothetical protein EXN66_Car015019 [Channa argus]KAK2895300.1 hypothetical protein Q8A73_014788 [Channa argus]
MHIKTMHKEKKKCCSAYLAAALFLACYCVQTVDSYRLRKTERRAGRKEVTAAKATGIQEGIVVFGRVFEKGSGFKSQVVDWARKTSSRAFVEDGSNYQADFTEWSQGQTHDTSSREAAWKRLASSLQCSDAQMLFRAVGPGASQFSLEQDSAPPMPLSQVPSACGYSMQSDPLALVMMVPYDGCNVAQEGGGHVLPMRWQGIPVSLWCPHSAASPNPTTVSQTPGNPGSVVVPEPSTEATTTAKLDMPTFQQYPFFFPFYSYYPFFPPPLPPTTTVPTTTAASTMSTTASLSTAAAGPHPMYPLPFNPSLYVPINWAFPGPFPESAEPTLTQTNLTEHWSLPFPHYSPYYYRSLPYNFFPHFPQYPIQMPEMYEQVQPDSMQYYFHDHSPAQVHF